MLPRPRRRFPLGIAALCLLSAVATLVVIHLPSPAEKATDLETTATTTLVSGSTVPVTGHGWGHGRGMSQYGAKGAALAGLSASQILDFYYPGTAATTLPARNIRVWISADDERDVQVLPSGHLAVYDDATHARQLLPGGVSRWRIVSTSTGSLQVQSLTGSTWTPYAVGGRSTLAGPVHFTGTDFVRLILPGNVVRGYRAEIIAQSTGPGTLRTVNLLPFEDYLRGVVPHESPSSWPAAALQAQTVAARSYAENKRARASAQAFDICDTTACQVYLGARSYGMDGGLLGSLEAASTDQAIAATGLQVRSYGGTPILAEFSSSNGGYTASGSAPYFVAKADPYEARGGNPYATWKVSIPTSTLQSAYGFRRLDSITVVDRLGGGGDWGGRMGNVTLRGIGTSGQALSVNTTGDRIRSAVGLKSNYFTFTGPAGGNPKGALDSVGPDRGYTGQVTVRGWSVDDDAPTTPTQVHVYVDGRGVASIRADQSRPDVGAAYPGVGDAHGYSTTLTLAPGAHTVCVYAINIGSGGNTRLGCKPVTVLDASPLGAVDGVTPAVTSGAVNVAGWAFDPSQPTQALAVHLYVDGRGAASVLADDARSDVAAANAAAGPAHGFSAPLTLTPGNRTVCAYAINVGSGTNKRIGCTTVQVVAPTPIGVLESVSPATSSDGRVNVRGWAFDPDDPSQSLVIRVYVDGHGYASMMSSTVRPDIASRYPGAGRRQGFGTTVTLPQGSHSVCAFAINIGAGGNKLLGCRGVRVADQAAFGSLDSVRGTGVGQITVRGWTIDPDTPRTPGRVHVYVDGAARGSFPADQPRSDIARVYPYAGSAHGFSSSVSVASGARRVCVYATSASGLARPRLLRCVSVTVP
jgi:SpoIID/LytB domain protein